jgi:DNA-directed RNA polymerase specialized sigma24 family protein
VLLFFVRLLGRYLNSGIEVERITRLRRRAASQEVLRTDRTTVRGPSRLTKEQNEEIAALYGEGWRAADIARVIGVTEWTVHHRLDRLGVQRRPISMTGAEILEALRLNDEGVPITELTKRFNRSWKTIHKELLQARQRSRSID